MTEANIAVHNLKKRSIVETEIENLPESQKKTKYDESQPKKIATSRPENVRDVIFLKVQDRVIETSKTTLKCPSFPNSFFARLADNADSYKMDEEGCITVEGNYKVIKYITDGLLLNDVNADDRPNFISTRRWVKYLDYYGLVKEDAQKEDPVSTLEDTVALGYNRRTRDIIERIETGLNTLCASACNIILQEILVCMHTMVSLKEGINYIHFPSKTILLEPINFGTTTKPYYIEDFIDRYPLMFREALKELSIMKLNGIEYGIRSDLVKWKDYKSHCYTFQGVAYNCMNCPTAYLGLWLVEMNETKDHMVFL